MRSDSLAPIPDKNLRLKKRTFFRDFMWASIQNHESSPKTKPKFDPTQKFEAFEISLRARIRRLQTLFRYKMLKKKK